MKDSTLLLSEEQQDFLSEMVNIGAGNAATALSQIFQVETDLVQAEIHTLPTINMQRIIDDPSLPVVCARMDMIGDVNGELFFIVEDKHKHTLSQLAQQSMRLRKAKRAVPDAQDRKGKSQISKSSYPNSEDHSVLTEIGNILAGVYLTAIHDFCRLNIYHSVPVIASDMIHSLLDEFLVVHSREFQTIILVKNEFRQKETHIESYFLIIPDVSSIQVLVDSIEQATEVMRQSGE